MSECLGLYSCVKISGILSLWYPAPCQNRDAHLTPTDNAASPSPVVHICARMQKTDPLPLALSLEQEEGCFNATQQHLAWVCYRDAIGMLGGDERTSRKQSSITTPESWSSPAMALQRDHVYAALQLQFHGGRLLLRDCVCTGEAMPYEINRRRPPTQPRLVTAPSLSIRAEPRCRSSWC